MADVKVSALPTVTVSGTDYVYLVDDTSGTPTSGKATVSALSSHILTGATVDVDGGTIDGAVIGGVSAAAITGTTITANSGFLGALTGNVTGNLTGDVTSTGTSTFATVDINGGAIDGAVIGGAAPAAGTFTTITLGTGANETVSGSIAGGRALFGYDVTGGNSVVQGGSGKGISFCVNNGTFAAGQAWSIASTGVLTLDDTITGAFASFGSDNVARTFTLSGGRASFGFNGANALVQGGGGRGVLLRVNNSTDAFFVNSSGLVGIGTTSPTEALDVNSDGIRVRTAQTPASATATGAQGQIAWDADYIYVCTATNTWKRAALSTW